MMFLAAQAQLAPMTKTQADELVSKPSAAITDALSTAPTSYYFTNDDNKNSVVYIGQTFRHVLINQSKPAFSKYNYGGNVGNANGVFALINSMYGYNAKVSKLDSHGINAWDEEGLSAFVYEGSVFEGIYAKGTTLKEKMAGNDNDLRYGKLLGWNTSEINGVKIDGVLMVDDGTGTGTLVQDVPDGIITPDELYTAMMKVVANNAAGVEKNVMVPNPAQAGGQEIIEDAHVLENGLDLAQLSQKLLHGAVSFSQSAGDYLAVDLKPGKGLTADNTTLISQKPYTVLQHHWDEAYGYFGAARNYLDYDIEMVYSCEIDGAGKKVCKQRSLDVYRTKKVKDGAGDLLYLDNLEGPDGRISLTSEKNFGMSVNAAKRDKSSKGTTTFMTSIVTPLIKGRHLIQSATEVPGHLEYAQALGVQAMHEWERLLAANTIHYINKTLSDYDKFGSADFSFAAFAKHFGELKGFAFAFQFNPNSVMFVQDDGSVSTDLFEKFHKLIRDVPAQPDAADVTAYKTDLLEARTILQDVYSFDKGVVETW